MSASNLQNLDLAPTTPDQRTWSWVNFAALWIGMAHCVPTWTMASGLIALGLTWWQAIGIIAAGNLIVLIPIVLNSHAGTRYGIPFPVLARASFGTLGANIPAVVRGLVAAVWFGIQVHIGGGALKILATQLVPSLATLNATQVVGYGLVDWVCYGLFLIVNLVALRHGMETLRKFELWAAPLVLVFAVAVCVWAVKTAGGLGPVVQIQSTIPVDMIHVVPKSIMSVIAFWSTLALNAPDFARFSKSQKDQAIGQALGLPTTMVAFSVLAVFTSSAMSKIYGKVIWDPIEMIQHLPSGWFTVVALIGILVATVSVNVPANLVSPGYDFSNLAPGKISFWQGALITAALATAMMPWRLLASAGSYVFAWLGTCGDLLGPVAGILIADYWLLRRTELDVDGLFDPQGPYRYKSGFNPIAIASLALGVGVALIGRVVPSLETLTDFGWLIGFLVGGGVYFAWMPKKVDNNG